MSELQISGRRLGPAASVATALSRTPGRERRFNDAGLPTLTMQYGPGFCVWVPFTNRTNVRGGGGGGGGGGVTPVDPSPLQAAISRVSNSTRVMLHHPQ